MQLAGRTALVTGGSDGIGREIARRLRTRGATVIVAGRDPGRVEAARGDGFEAIQADQSNPEGIDGLMNALDGRTIDILVNNAGMGANYMVDETIDLAEIDRCLFLNLTAPIHLTTRLLPMLRSRPDAMIVNVTSGLAIAPRASSPVYCATKAGLRSFTMALRAQLRDSKVRVLEVLPPVVETRMTAGFSGGKMPAAECARQAVAAIEAGRDEANVGQVKLLRFIYSLSPAFARRTMLRF
jgi:uncharacterized oxidoreductase